MKLGDIVNITSELNQHWKGKVVDIRKQYGAEVVDIVGIDNENFKATSVVSCFIFKNDEYWMYNADNYCIICNNEGQTSTHVLGYGVCADCTRRIVRNHILDNKLINEKNKESESCQILRAFKNDLRIETDIHTNKHYDLIKGKMWIKGNATGKFWSLLCNSRDAQKEARNILKLY